MTDETPSEQPHAPEYPFFEPTREGLMRVHQEYGRLMHQMIERNQDLDRLRVETRRLQMATRAFTAKHTGNECKPAEDVTEMPQARRKGAG